MGQDDLLFSKSAFRDWFALTKTDEVENTSSRVVYTIEDYDLVGPDDFHMDRSLDKLRNNIYNKPWLNVQIIFTSAEGSSDGVADEATLSLIYPLEERHMLINKGKKSFRPQKP